MAQGGADAMPMLGRAGLMPGVPGIAHAHWWWLGADYQGRAIAVLLLERASCGITDIVGNLAVGGSSATPSARVH